ncbi:MAG TPA: choice-of-anchor K domain-containing protein, partial [Woeseiaceae bacterium]|nr:choice-of-anchor K domain-containing protein [Woeseiaceae bacterium]
MKQSFNILGILVLASAALLPTGSAFAQNQITFTSAIANWHSPTDDTPGSQPGDPVITNGVPTSSISWGTTTGPQSGYDVTVTIPDPLMFPVVVFAHRNFPVSDPSLTSVQLDIILDFEVDGAQTGPLTFTFTFTHEETPNNQNPCPYPTPPGEGCTDRVTFIDMPDPTTFTVGGVTYTLGLSFLDDAGNPVDEFITSEGGVVNTANLDGQFVVVPPVLEVTKSGPATMGIGQPGVFAIDIRNTGPNDAWDITVSDVLPDGPTGGMCDYTPQVLSAQVFAADGVTPVPGKGPLLEGTDYTLSYTGAPACELNLAMLTPAAAVDTDQRLIITYRTQLDADSQDGATLTNVAGAIEWSDDLSSNPDRTTYTRTLTDGTPGVLDHEDAHTVQLFIPALLFEKTAVNVTSGEDPATVATAGDTLRYRLRIENLSDTPLTGLRIVDELDHLNATAMFEAGTLNVVTVPAGADSSATDPAGGAAGSGLLDVNGLSLAGLGDSVLIEFEVDLVPAIADGTLVYNQSELRSGVVPIALSDDPYVNGAADPGVAGDEDPTQILIESPPAFRIEKISTYLGANPNVLLAGETLRYTITVQNTGSADATGVELVDQLPASTTYVAGSTTLNGAAIPDSATGGLPLVDGILINAPQDPTPGVMNGGVADNTATITFDVTVYPDVPDGTVISNQAFVSAPGYGIADQPSDDPRTPIVDDPTRDIVGNLPLLFAPKSAALQVDLGSPGIVDPGDVLRYTIQIYNNGSIPATAVELSDVVPADTTYVADTVTVNGLPAGQPDGGVFPLIAGIPVSSADLTPPLPAAGGGVLTAGESAIVQFDLQVNAGTPTGTLITNQAVVYSIEVPNLLTDGDGNPATGPEPTVVVVGDAQQLTITKGVSVVNGGPALAGSTLEYVVTVTNVGAVPALYVLITDNLDDPFPGYLTYVDQSATLNGFTNGVTFAGTTLTADYFTEYGPLNPGQTAVLRFRAIINPTLVDGTPVTNTAQVTWNDPTQYATASVTIDVGAVVGFGMLSGTVWHDADFDDTPDIAERLLEGWLVELLMNGQPIRSITTGTDGTYLMAGVAPNYLTPNLYSLRFSAPGAGPRTAALGRSDSDFTDYLQRIDDIVVTPNSNLLALNLPIDPNGVVYDAISRSPIAGATVTLFDSSGVTAIPATCFDDPVQQDQMTTANGYFKFDINFSEPGCPSGGNYLIRVTPPGSSYVQGPSALIPPVSDLATLPFNVPACPGSASDAVVATGQHCEVQLSEFAPGVSVPARSTGTNYHSYLTLDDSQQPGTGQLFNNHIPLDPVLTGA